MLRDIILCLFPSELERLANYHRDAAIFFGSGQVDPGYQPLRHGPKQKPASHFMAERSSSMFHEGYAAGFNERTAEDRTAHPRGSELDLFGSVGWQREARTGHATTLTMMRFKTTPFRRNGLVCWANNLEYSRN